jgi:O-antigen/teichoic acid export membrane protein
MPSSSTPPSLPGAAPAGVPRSHARRIFRNTGILAVSGLIVRGMGMAMMVVLARYLGAEGYGAYQRAESFVFMFSILASLGLDMILTREVARQSPQAPAYLAGTTILKLLLAPACFALILGLAYARGYHGTFLFGIWCYSFVLLLTVLGQSMDAVFQGLDNMRNIAIGNLVNQVAFVSLGATFVWLHKDLRWILLTLVAAGIVRLCVSYALLSRLHLRWERPSMATLGYLLKQSVPIAFAASFVVVYQQLDAVLLGELKGNTQVGWYKATAKFMLLFTVLRESFLVAIYPAFSALAHDRERIEGLVTRAIRYQLVGALYFIVCFVMLPRVAPKLLGADFAGTAAILPIMAWMLVPQTISITMGRLLVASGNQNRIAVATGLALVVNAGLNLLLIPRFESMGAAAAGAISEVAVAAVNVYYVHRYVTRTHVLRATLRPVGAAILAGVALHFLPAMSLALALPLAGLMYLAALLAFRTFSMGEINLVLGTLREGIDRLRGSDEAAARRFEPH